MRRLGYLIGLLLLIGVGVSVQGATVATTQRQDRQQQPPQRRPARTDETRTPSRTQSEIPALTDENDQRLRSKLEKELALIKKYYTDRHDAPGFARYQSAEHQNVGDDLNDLKRARELVLTNLHIPLPN